MFALCQCVLTTGTRVGRNSTDRNLAERSAGRLLESGAMGLIEPPALLHRHRLTVDQYHRMAEAGVLAADARVELIEGEIVDMAPIGSRHASAVKRLNRLFSALVAERAIVAVQDPVRLDEHNQPEPDLMLLAPRTDFYASAHPTPAADVLLLVEVSDTTARYDRQVKLGLYARHGVHEVWIIDLDNRVLHQYSGPQGNRYTEVNETARPGMLAPLLLPGLEIDASTLLA
jgi:Uma2 family endonuclease